MTKNNCVSCDVSLPSDAFRKNSKEVCTWCQWDSPEKRAKARYKDKAKADRTREENDKRLKISEEDFVDWYLSQDDCCHYCGTTREEAKKLLLKRGSFGYFVSWDIDRKDSSKPYESGNIVLSCFMCNMAKASYFSMEETYILGAAVRKIIEQRLAGIVPSKA